MANMLKSLPDLKNRCGLTKNQSATSAFRSRHFKQPIGRTRTGLAGGAYMDPKKCRIYVAAKRPKCKWSLPDWPKRRSIVKARRSGARQTGGARRKKKKKKKKDQEYNCDFCLLGKKLRKIAGSGGLVGHGNHAG